MQTPPPLPRPAPPVLLVNAHSKPPVNSTASPLPLFEDKERLIRYGKWGGLALLGLIVLSALIGNGETANNDSYDPDSSSYSSSSEGSYEDRMNAGIAELGGTYDSSSGTMTTNR